MVGKTKSHIVVNKSMSKRSTKIINKNENEVIKVEDEESSVSSTNTSSVKTSSTLQSKTYKQALINTTSEIETTFVANSKPLLLDSSSKLHVNVTSKNEKFTENNETLSHYEPNNHQNFITKKNTVALTNNGDTIRKIREKAIHASQIENPRKRNKKNNFFSLSHEEIENNNKTTRTESPSSSDGISHKRRLKIITSPNWQEFTTETEKNHDETTGTRDSVIKHADEQRTYILRTRKVPSVNVRKNNVQNNKPEDRKSSRERSTNYVDNSNAYPPNGEQTMRQLRSNSTNLTTRVKNIEKRKVPTTNYVDKNTKASNNDRKTGQMRKNHEQ